MPVAVIPFKVGNVEIGGRDLFLIAGPCLVESEAHALKMAHAISSITERLGIPYIFKSSYDKANRTSINAHRGLGIEEALLRELETEIARRTFRIEKRVTNFARGENRQGAGGGRVAAAVADRTEERNRDVHRFDGDADHAERDRDTDQKRDAAALQVPANDANAANGAAAQRPFADGVALAVADDAEVAPRRPVEVCSVTAQPHTDEREGKSRTTSGCSAIKSLTTLNF